MSDLENLLLIWGLKHLIHVLKENEINNMDNLSDLLKDCNFRDFEQLIPNVKDRIILRKKYNDYSLTSSKIPDSLNCPSSTSSTLPSTASPSSTPSLIFEIIDNPTLHEISNILPENQDKELLEIENKNQSEIDNSSSDIREPSPKRRKFDKEEFNLKNILSKTAYGQTLTQISKHEQTFTTRCQSILCHIIVTHFLNLDIRSLKNEDFEHISDQIIELFPHENKEVYFIPPIRKKDSKENKAGISRGKLVDRFRNDMKFLNSANYSKKSDERNIINTALDTAEQHRIWLIHNQSPKEEVIKKWDESYNLRMNDCENKLFKNINDIIKRWSILTSNFGYELIERDFERKYPQCRDKLIVSWNWHFEKLYKLLKKNLSTGDRLNEILMKSQSLDLNSKTILQIWISLALLAPKSTKVSTKTDGGRRRVWKPTIAESRDGILVHCKIFGDIEQMCINKQNKMSQMNLTMQPFVIVVGPEVTSIELLIKKGLDDSLKIGKYIGIASIESTNVAEIDYSGCLTEVSWIRFNSILFKRDFVIITDSDENNLSFGIMIHIKLDENKDIFVYYRKCVTLGLDMHFKAYEILLPACENSLTDLNVIKISKSLNIRTCNYHISGDGRYFISVFDI